MEYIVLLRTIFQMLCRDFYVYSKRIKNYGINFLLIIPILSIITFGYIQPGIYFGAHHAQSSIALLIGMFVVNMLALCFTLLSPFIFDLETDRFIDYQQTLLPPQFLLLQMLLFPCILTNLISLPFFPLARIILPSYFEQINPHWPALLLMIFFISVFCTSYIFLALCILKKSANIRQFWLRFNWPLMVLGGFWVPWYIFKQYSPVLATISLLNPFTYITEGLRSTLLGSDIFIAYPLCIAALIFFIGIFISASIYFFKQKLDHI